MNPYVVLDVFTDTPLQGNPVAIFTDADAVDPNAMQPLARELNLSETVFLHSDNRVRIFTPAVELPFAGHPLLGTAFYVGERDGVDSVRLETGAGSISIELVREAASGAIRSGEMTQPLPVWAAFDDPEAVLGALRLPAGELPLEVSDNGPRFVYVGVDDVETLSALRPDLNALARLGTTGVSCFTLTGAEPATARVRMFAPGAGVAEDPATGSAAGPLAVHLARHGRIRFGEPLTITQGVEIGRPSTLVATAHGGGETVERVTVAGCAVTVAQGYYHLG